jgi:hypothetical protein
MAGLDPAIHAFRPTPGIEPVDARIKSGHDVIKGWIRERPDVRIQLHPPD